MGKRPADEGSVTGMKGVVQVDRGQRGEDVSLQHGDQDLERGERDGEGERERSQEAPRAGRQQRADEAREDLQGDVARSMFAKRRTLRLIGREMNEITSIGTRMISMIGCTPDGTNRPKKCVRAP